MVELGLLDCRVGVRDGVGGVDGYFGRDCEDGRGVWTARRPVLTDLGSRSEDGHHMNEVVYGYLPSH